MLSRMRIVPGSPAKLDVACDKSVRILVKGTETDKLVPTSERISTNVRLQSRISVREERYH